MVVQLGPDKKHVFRICEVQSYLPKHLFTSPVKSSLFSGLYRNFRKLIILVKYELLYIDNNYNNTVTIR